MPTINTSRIEGFDGMSAEEKIAALLRLEIPEEVDMSQYVPKAVADKHASDAAALKKQLRDRQSEEERDKAEKDAKWAEMVAKVEQLEREKIESTYTVSYMKLPGYDEALAADTAKAMASGDYEKVFSNQAKAAENAKKAFEKELVGRFPAPDGTGGESGQDSAGVAFVKTLSKERADANKESERILDHFFK